VRQLLKSHGVLGVRLGLGRCTLHAVRPSLPSLLVLLSGLAAFATQFSGGSATAGEVSTRYTDETPDSMLDRAVERATRKGATDVEALAAIAEIGALADRVTRSRTPEALAAIANATSLKRDVRAEAILAIGRLATPLEPTEGVLNRLAVIGPFRDTGGGLDAKEGPEAAAFGDPNASYAWGTVDVRWKSVPPNAARNALPLDLFISPRKESCSIVATTITLENDQPIDVRLAASGQARLMFDSTLLGKSDAVNAKGWFDRLGARVKAAKGVHTVYAKVCTGALEDEGRVRLRITDKNGEPIDVHPSQKLQSTLATEKVAVERIDLPSARSLISSGSNDALLSAAILRTLGGLDDLRSPRAPGMLDELVQKRGVTGDRLAMCGWVSPSGANRSGWLDKARQQAIAAGDSKTLAFAERRLIAERLALRLADWAMAEANAAHLEQKSDDEATLMRALIFDTLGTQGLKLRALSLLKDAFTKNPKGVPVALLSKLAELASGMDPAIGREAYVALSHDRGTTYAPEHAYASAPLGKDVVVHLATTAFATGLESTDDGVSLARTVSAANAHDVAAQLLSMLAAWSPNRADVWGALARERAFVEKGAASRDTLAALARARDLAPGDATYRTELSLRVDSPAAKTAADDEKYLRDSSVLLSRRQGVHTDGPPESADRELYWLRAVTMHEDARVSQLIHYAREIVIAPRTESELYEDLPQEGDLTEILRARVHRKSGAVAFPSEEHNSGARPRIRWPELLPGDTVEVAVRTWTRNAIGGRGDAPFHFIDYAGATNSHPLLYNEVIVESPQSRPLYIDVLRPGAHKRIDRNTDGKRFTQLVWDQPIRIADEPLAPPMSELVPVIVGSTFKNWSDFRAWYAEAVKGFTEPDAEVKRIAEELTKGKQTREDKLKALFEFVSDDIRYVNYVSGEWWLPNRPQQLLARRAGDCDDKAILLITLLKSIGIDAEEVLVQTRMTAMPSVLAAKNAAIPLFDHGIAFLPGPNGGMYLDATSPQSRLGPIPSMDARASALRMQGPAEIVTLPRSSPDDHGSDVDWKLTLRADGSGEVAGIETHSGDSAFWLRTYLSEPDARHQYVEGNLVAGWFPTVEVDRNIEFEGNLSKGRAIVKYKARSDGIARKELGDLVVPISQSSTLASQLAPLVERTQPVQLPPYFAPSHQARTIRISAPLGYTIAELPPGGEENGGAFGKAKLEITKDKNDPRTVIVKRTLIFDEHRILPDQYAAWRVWLQRVDSLMHKGVRFVREGAR